MEKNKVLIMYGTRYGATKTTVEEIAKNLLEKEFNVKIVDAKTEKV